MSIGLSSAHRPCRELLREDPYPYRNNSQKPRAQERGNYIRRSALLVKNNGLAEYRSATDEILLRKPKKKQKKIPVLTPLYNAHRLPKRMSLASLLNILQ